MITRMPVMPITPDRLSGTWVINPACATTDKGALPPSFTITFKSRDAATGKRTYHVSFSVQSPFATNIPKDASVKPFTFDQDKDAADDSYLQVQWSLPVWNLGWMIETPSFGLYFRPSKNPNYTGMLEVGLTLYTLGVDWVSPASQFNDCLYYVRANIAEVPLRAGL